MASSGRNKFLLSIVLPSVLTIALFIVSFYLVLVPLFEKNMMERKKEMISELTNTALSLVKDYYDDYHDGIIPLDEAKTLASQRLGEMRYGSERKDYFWITDTTPVMIMHPYRKELIGTDLNDYTDPDGKKLFVESAELVNEAGEGFIDYKWQWKDDTSKVVPKLSYVRGFSEWGWIIGTGIYLEDVNQEIRTLERNLLWISFIIVFVVALVLAYINRQSMIIERRRRETENKLLISKQRYKSLVEASSDGTLMIIDRKPVYVNQKFLDLTGYSRTDLEKKGIPGLFGIDWENIESSFRDPGKSASFETTVLTSEKGKKEVIISVSEVDYFDSKAYILIVKEPLKKDIHRAEKEKMHYDLQTSLLFMSQPVNNFLSDYISCDIDTSITKAAELMIRKEQDVIFIKQGDNIIGTITRSDITERQLAKGIDPSVAVTSIMSSPVRSISGDAQIAEAIIRCRTEGISHLLVSSGYGNYTGYVSYEKLLEAQQNPTGMIEAEIRHSESVENLKRIYNRMTALIEIMADSAVRSEAISWVISRISDLINYRVIELSIEKEGESPCEFCFISMGSQGRSEQTLATDQDNGIIIDDAGCGKSGAEEYFLRLGRRINESLDKIGFKYCPGKFMAGNPEWNLPLIKWKQIFTGWIRDSDPQSLLDVNIFFDFRAIYGKCELAEELRNHINLSSKDKAVFFYHLSQTVTRLKLPLGLFGKLVGEQETSESNYIDIKKLLLTVTGFARIYALREGISETSTMTRLQKLRKTRIISDSFIDEIIKTYSTLMYMRVLHQVEQIRKGEDPDNSIDINRLTEIEKTTFKKVVSVINEIMMKLKSDFKGSLQ